MARIDYRCGPGVFLFDVPEFELPLEGSYGDAQGVSGVGSVSERFFQGRKDGFFFQIVEVEVSLVGMVLFARGVSAEVFGEISQAQDAFVPHDEHIFDNVAQLPNVAWPLVGLEVVEQFRSDLRAWTQMSFGAIG